MQKTAEQIADQVLEKCAVSPELAQKALTSRLLKALSKYKPVRGVPGKVQGAGGSELFRGNVGADLAKFIGQQNPRTSARAFRNIDDAGYTRFADLIKKKSGEPIQPFSFQPPITQW